jgi:hypothetical protein
MDMAAIIPPDDYLPIESHSTGLYKSINGKGCQNFA